MADNSRKILLRMQYDTLLKLARRSDFITITPIEVRPGWPPEKYIITYSCLGIADIEDEGEPVIAEHHQMKMYLDYDYPRSEPHMLFTTPIWHPNVSSEEPRAVCTDKTMTWWAGKNLDELVVRVGELIQYKHYHAKNEPPFPQDRKVAEWVLCYAEPRGLIGPGKPLDARPLLRGHRIRQNHEPCKLKRIRLGSQSSAAIQPAESAAQTGATVFTCPKCGAKARLKPTNQERGKRHDAGTTQGRSRAK